jgi:hypothetical protein
MLGVVLLVTVFSPIFLLPWRRPKPARIAYRGARRNRKGHDRG